MSSKKKPSGRKHHVQEESFEIHEAVSRLDVVRLKLADALRDRAEATTDQREQAELAVMELQQREIDIKHHIQALRAAETIEREAAAREKRRKKKSVSHKAEQIIDSEFEAAIDWAEAEAVDDYLSVQEDLDSDSREHNREVFRQAAAAERHDAQRARELEHQRRREIRQAEEQAETLRRQEEARLKRETRKALSLRKKEAAEAERRSKASERMQNTGQTGPTWLDGLKEFFRGLLGQD